MKEKCWGPGCEGDKEFEISEEFWEILQNLKKVILRKEVKQTLDWCEDCRNKNLSLIFSKKMNINEFIKDQIDLGNITPFDLKSCGLRWSPKTSKVKLL